MIPLGLVFAREQLHVPRRRAPVDATVILRGVVFAQGVVFGAVVELVLHTHAVDVVEREQVRRIGLDAFDIGRHQHLGVELQPGLHIDQAEKALPAYEQGLQAPRAARQAFQGQGARKGRLGMFLTAHDARIVAILEHFIGRRPQLHGGRLAPAREAQRKRNGARTADADGARQLQIQHQAIARRRKDRVDQAGHHHSDHKHRHPGPQAGRKQTHPDGGEHAQDQQDQQSWCGIDRHKHFPMRWN